MIRVTKNKSDFIPLRHVFNGVIIAFNYEPFYEYVDAEKVETDVATWTEAIIYPKPSLNEIKDFILGVINENTDKKILSGFKWKDMQVWLSSENQFNYKATYDLAVMKESDVLPVVFKFGSSNNPIYYEFTTVDELEDFYLNAITYIRDTLADGWKMKDSINWNEYEEALMNIG